MMDKSERGALFRSLTTVIKETVSTVEGSLRKWVSDEIKAAVDLFEERAKEIPPGRDGKDGRDGIDGKDGAPGRDGQPGIDGKDGPAGRDGKDAAPIDMKLVHSLIRAEVAEGFHSLPKPKNGENGLNGKDGAPGPQGVPGERGERGEPGKDGKDADLMQVKEFIGSEVEKAVAAIPKPQDGQPGKDGESIHPDTVSLMVAKEVRAVLAEWPKPQDGRDGIQLETVPFHQDKQYPRGACVAFGGGTWRAFRETTAGTPSAKNGWEVLLNGYHPPEIIQSEDGRTVKHIIQMTDGTVAEKEFYYPNMLHRGVYEARYEYVRGDCVTYDNSTWHCRVDVTKSVPSTNTDWQLIAKHGRDGKDFRPQEKTVTPPLSLK